MSEPEWVYRRRRQRAVVAVLMVFGLIASAAVLGPVLANGLNMNLDGRDRVAIDKPDPDVILAREKRQNAAAKRRKAERRAEAQARAELRRARARRAKSEPPQDNPSTAPAPAAPRPNPATAEAPQLPQPAAPQPQAPAPTQPTSGGVDPRFY